MYSLIVKRAVLSMFWRENMNPHETTSIIAQGCRLVAASLRSSGNVEVARKFEARAVKLESLVANGSIITPEQTVSFIASDREQDV